MKPRALVVEDDPILLPTIKSLMASLQHKYDWVSNQGDARDLLQREDFDYVLLDLQIPALPDCCVAEIQYGVSLLHEIHEIKSGQLPVVIMTSHTGACVDMATELIAAGARGFIAKPLLNKSREFTKKIREVLTKRPGVGKRASHAGSLQRFAGGELAFFDDRVELAGVKIISDRNTGQTMMVLDVLRQQDDRGQYVCLSGDEIAQSIRAPGGATAITAYIHLLRTNITQRLRRKLGMEVGPEDAIAHNEQGYFLRDWIAVRNRRDAVDAGDSHEAQRTTTLGAEISERQAWILSEVKRGVPVQRAMVERRFGVVGKTAQRDLAELARRGHIEFVRTGRTGYYQRF